MCFLILTFLTLFFTKVTKVRKVKIKNKKYLLRRVVRNIGRINRALLNLYKKKTNPVGRKNIEKFIFVYNRLITLYKVTFQVTLEYFFAVAVIVTHSRRGQKIEFSNNFVASRSNVLLQNFYIHRGVRVCYHICFAYQIDVTLSILSVRYYSKTRLSSSFFFLRPYFTVHSSSRFRILIIFAGFQK